jgi:preprotein translocase subunit SecD
LRRDLRWKLAIIVIVIGVSVWFTFPLGKRMNLGLDLQGGMHLVLEVEAEKAVDSTTDRLVTEASESLAKLSIPGLEVRKVTHDQLVVKFSDAGRAEAVADAMKAFSSLVAAGAKGGTELSYKLDTQRVQRIMDSARDRAISW